MYYLKWTTSEISIMSIYCKYAHMYELTQGFLGVNLGFSIRGHVHPSVSPLVYWSVGLLPLFDSQCHLL